jgi:hypothetical protein
MLNQKSLLAGAATCAMACASVTLGAGAFTEGPFNDIFFDTTNWGPENLIVPQFDEMGGSRTLTCVKIEWVAGVAGDARAESLDNAPSIITATLAADIMLDGPSGFSENPMPSDSEMFNASEHDGTIDFAGTSGVVFPNLAGSEGGTVTFTLPADLLPFKGNGTVTFVASATAMSTATGPGNLIQQFMTNASAEVTITYEYDQETTTCEPGCKEPNDVCDPLDLEGSCSLHDFLLCGKYIDDKLEKRIEQGCEPDTYLVLFNKLNAFLNSNDNGSNKGNGWASGLFGVDGTNGIVDNLDGTFSLRIGVTGRADGFDGNFNGLFQNGPHGQLGKFKLYVTFLDDEGDPLVNPILPNGAGISPNPVCYEDEFNSGAEAFHINYTLPFGTESVDICIDNVIACEELRNDVDFFCIDGLVPLCDYCITQIGGLDCECIPTATAIGWFDKSCTLIFKEQGNHPTIPGYTQLCVPADANGRILIAVSGAGDCDFNGLDDALQDLGDPRAPSICPEPTPGHGVAGCYTLCIEVVGDHGGTPPGDGGGTGGEAVMQEALNHGDLNMDGVTNTADLGILIGNFGWIAAP